MHRRGPISRIGKGLADTRLDHIIARLHLGQLGMIAAHRQQRRLEPSLAAKVILQRRLDRGIDVAVGVELFDHISAVIRIERVDGLIDHAKTEVGADWLSLPVAGKHFVAGGLLRLKDLLVRRYVKLQLLLYWRNL